MARQTWQHRYFIAASPARIYAHLSEPSSYIGLSPLVIEVRDVSRSANGEGRAVCQYTSVELFKFFGLIPYRNPIRVTTTFTRPDEQMVSDVDSPLNVRVRFVFALQAENGGAWMTETVTAEAPGLLLGYVVSQAKAVQQARARILKARLEA